MHSSRPDDDLHTSKIFAVFSKVRSTCGRLFRLTRFTRTYAGDERRTLFVTFNDAEVYCTNVVLGGGKTKRELVYDTLRRMTE